MFVNILSITIDVNFYKLKCCFSFSFLKCILLSPYIYIAWANTTEINVDSYNFVYFN